MPPRPTFVVIHQIPCTWDVLGLLLGVALRAPGRDLRQTLLGCAAGGLMGGAALFHRTAASSAIPPDPRLIGVRVMTGRWNGLTLWR